MTDAERGRIERKRLRERPNGRRIYISNDLHARLKTIAGSRQMTLQRLTDELLRNSLGIMEDEE